MRQTVWDAPAHSDVLFSPGEYEGPFIINRPMRLIGQGKEAAAVTLWARYAPVIIVRSPDVVLMNLRVETTFAPAPALWYEPGCRPDSRRAEMSHNEVEMPPTQQTNGWHLPNLIDLGELPPQQMVNLPLTITVPAPAQLSETLVGLQLTPSQLVAPGQHQLQLTITADKLMRDTLLAGQIVIRTAHETRAIWVVGRVTEQSQWAYPKLILVSQSGRKFAFGARTVLGQAQLMGEAGAAKLSASQAQLQQETNGTWTLIQPAPVTQPTRIQGQILEMGQRRVLKTDEQVQLGAIQLRVETQQTDLPLTVASELDFGKLNQPKATRLTLQNNRKVVPWAGTLHSTVDWLTVPQPRVSCLGGQTIHVPVELTPLAQQLPPQRLYQLGALVLSGAHESWLINVRLEIDDLAPKLTVEPTVLDWGEVFTWRQVHAQTLHLRNQGATAWIGRITNNVPWLEVRPTQLACPPHGEAVAQIYITQAIETLSSGQIEVAKALSLSDGSGATRDLAARLTLNLPQLEAIPSQIELTVQDKSNMPRSIIRLRNLSGQIWSGSVRSTLPWLEVAPLQLNCPPHGETLLQVWLNDQTRRIFGQPIFQVADALEVTGQGATLLISCYLTINVKPTSPLPTLTEPLQTLVDFGQISPNPSAWPTREIRLTNPRPWSVEGRAQSMVPWLEIMPHQFTHASKEEVVFQVRLTREALKLKEPRYDVSQAIVIQSGDQRHAFRVKLAVELVASPTVTAPPPRSISNTSLPLWAARPARKVTAEYKIESSQITVNQTRLDFGTLKRGRGSIPLTSQEIHVSHESLTQTLPIQVQSMVPWLSVTPHQVECAPRQTVWVTIQLTSAARSLTPRVYDVPDAILIQSGDQKIMLAARLEVSRG